MDIEKKKVDNTFAGLFMIIFMASWFTAIWIYHWQLFLTGLFAFILGVIVHEKE